MSCEHRLRQTLLLPWPVCLMMETLNVLWEVPEKTFIFCFVFPDRTAYELPPLVCFHWTVYSAAQLGPAYANVILAHRIPVTWPVIGHVIDQWRDEKWRLVSHTVSLHARPPNRQWMRGCDPNLRDKGGNNFFSKTGNRWSSWTSTFYSLLNKVAQEHTELR